MLLHFPNSETLQLAVSAGIAPSEVTTEPVKANFGEDGSIWLESQAALDASVRAELRKLKVRIPKKSPLPCKEEFLCWHQVLPTRKSELAVSEKSAVLFELGSSEQLAELVAEMLRLGNDRQSFRYLQQNGAARAMLRVVGPPYYSLLRSIEGGQSAQAPQAYVEQRTGIWVEAGRRHPLADSIQPPAGQWLLIRGDRQWRLLENAPFRDVYEILDFKLPAGPLHWQETEPAGKIQVPLRLSADSNTDPAELWVLGEEGAEAIDRFVRESDNHQVSQLAFAVGQMQGRRTFVLRSRPARRGPPTLVLPGVAFRPYLKLPNLFLPVGWRLHPPLQRDAVKRLLADDRNLVTWLQPEGENGFAPHSLADDAFRPLADWVEYVMDCESEQLQAWTASARFEFDSFICRDDQLQAAKKPPKKGEKRSGKKSSGSTTPPDGQKTEAKPGEAKTLQAEKIDVQQLLQTEEVKLQPSLLQQQLHQLESEFLNLENEPLDGPVCSDLWRRMAPLYAALGHRPDATLCNSLALWERESPTAQEWSNWLACECSGKSVELTKKTLEDLLNGEPIAGASSSLLAAWLCFATREESVAALLRPRLAEIGRFLQEHEGQLPYRVMWLAWASLVELSQGDVLALARARDRLLERLHTLGMRPEFEAPSFLRLQGAADVDRFRTVRERVVRLRKSVSAWCAADLSSSDCTAEYADLMFAVALARLGETTHANELLASATAAIDVKAEHSAEPEIHGWLKDVFCFRVAQALEGTPHPGRLPNELLKRLEEMAIGPRQKANWIRKTRVVEPSERVNIYSKSTAEHVQGVIGRDLAKLPAIHNANELQTEVQRLLALVQSARQPGGQHALILAACLAQSPRLGAAVAQNLLAELPRIFDARIGKFQSDSEEELVNLGTMLEAGLRAAAHFGEVQYVEAASQRIQAAVAHFVALQRLAREVNTQDARNFAETLKMELQALLSSCFLGLRKLGLRDSIGRMLAGIDETLRQEEAQQKKRLNIADQADRVQVQLHVAAGWLYFSQPERASDILDNSRDLLADENLKPFKKTPLACTYIDALGQGPAGYCLDRLEDLFGEKQLCGISDTMASSSHYSIAKLKVVDAVVQALVGDDFALDRQSRRWLDEDELLLRRRVHADTRLALQKAGL